MTDKITPPHGFIAVSYPNHDGQVSFVDWRYITAIAPWTQLTTVNGSSVVVVKGSMIYTSGEGGVRIDCTESSAEVAALMEEARKRDALTEEIEREEALDRTLARAKAEREAKTSNM